jgi:hypothetical protein
MLILAMRGTLRITLGTAHDPAMPSVIRVQAWTSGAGVGRSRTEKEV